MEFAINTNKLAFGLKYILSIPLMEFLQVVHEVVGVREAAFNSINGIRATPPNHRALRPSRPLSIPLMEFDDVAATLEAARNTTLLSIPLMEFRSWYITRRILPTVNFQFH